MYPKVFEDLIYFFRQLPGVGEKTAERYAYAFLKMDDLEIEEYSEVLKKVKSNINNCSKCGVMCEGSVCSVCGDNKRNKNQICVVQTSKEVFAIERAGFYDGLYHVLNGEISPTKGVVPNDLTIDKLIDRIDENVEEIIIATNPTVDGEITAMYISKLLKEKKVTVTRIANGLPMGGHVDYADDMTLLKAMSGRQEIK